MAKKMTFSVSLSLLTKNFNKGIKAVQNSLRSLRAQFQTFVGGIGIGLGFQELIDNAKNLDKVQTTLRNVSGSYEQYGENMKFIQGLSKKYNQDLITLTGNYAKFYSAASYAGFVLEEQQHIYESLTRASTFFNLSADETNGVFLAIQQMISKGKVSSEELRRQLGERLPGAMNIAAKAMGVSTAELDNMIRKGDVLAKDLLPKLADELNKLTVNIDTNTIEGATNKLKNSFTGLVQKLKVGDIYKVFLNGVSSGLDYLTKNLRDVAYAISGVLGTLFLKGGMEKGVSGWNKFFKNLEGKLSAAQVKTKVLKAELEEFAKTNNIALARGGAHGERLYVPRTQRNSPDTEKLTEARKLSKEYIQQLREENILQQQLNNKLGVMGNKIWENVKAFGKMIGIQAVYTAIAAAISTIVTKMVSWYREQKRIKNLVKDTAKEYDKMVNKLGGDDIELQGLMAKQKEDGTWEAESDKDREKRLKRINYLLGLSGEEALTVADSNDKINAAIKERLNLLKQEREYQAARQIAAESQTSRDAKSKELEDAREELAQLKKDIEKQDSRYVDTYTGELTNLGASRKKALDSKIALLVEEIGNLDKIIAKYSEEVKKLGLDAQERQETIDNVNYNPNPNEDKTELEIEFEKIQKDYNNKLRALKEQLADKIITETEYDKELEKLTLSTLNAIYALDNIDENSNTFAKAIKEAALGYINNKEKEDKVNDALQDYYKNTLLLADQLEHGLITQKEYEDALLKLKEEVLKNLLSFGDLTAAAEELADTYRQRKKYNANKEAADLVNSEMPTLGSRDTFFDYKKQDSEKFEEMAAIYNDYVDKLNDLISKIEDIQAVEPTGRNADMLEELNTILEQATQNADSFSQAAKFAEVQEDVKNLKQELNEGIWDNITGIATAAERLTNSFKSLQETWDDPDASGWEKFITTFTTIISVIETIVSVVKTFNAAMKVAEALSLATAAAEGAQIPVKVQDAIVTKAQAAAAKELAVARHLAASASVPYPANIAAIASTSAALAAAFAAIPKFAHGGYVKGNSTHGDKVLARLNSGELVLNKGQQATLFNLLNGKGGLGGNGNVEFKIKGTELIGVLNNYSKKISK
jgi:tape measure domain-containing protein